MKKTIIIFIILITAFLKQSEAQIDRIKNIENILNEIAKTSAPGLNQKVDFAVSGVSLQEFLRGIAESNNLNISISPDLSSKVYNNFKQEKVINIILFLVKEYELEVTFSGSIMSFSKYIEPKKLIPITQKEIKIKYNQYNNLISFDLNSDSLFKVIRKMIQVTKKNIVISPNIPDKKISIYIEELPFESALEKLAFANELKVSKSDDNIYILQKNDSGDNSIQLNNLGANKKNKKNINKSSGQGYLSITFESDSSKKNITVNSVNASLGDIIKLLVEETNINSYIYSELKGFSTLNISNVSIDQFLSSLFSGTEYTFKVENNVYLIGERKSEGFRTNKIIQLRNRSVDNILETIPTDIKKNVEIKIFKELNSILLSGSKPQIDEINTFIDGIDRVVPMITIEVILLDIKKGKSIKTGIKAGFSDSVKSGGTILSGLDFTADANSVNEFLSKIGTNNTLNIGKVTSNFYVTLNALEQNNNVEVRSMPKLTTLNGHEASLSIGNTRYYVITTQNIVGNLNPNTVVTQQYNSVQANLSINIVPVVSGDEQVTLSIDVNISDFTEENTLNSPPPSTNSQFKSLIRARNDEMIVLGGIERTEKSESGSGIPLLSRIPLLKWFFSSKSKSNNKIISVVFIKPSINY